MGKSASKTKYVDLFDAASQGDVQGVKYFVEKEHVSVDTLNSQHQCVAHAAVENGHLNVVKYVLSKNPFLFLVEDDKHDTIFHVALKKGFIDIVDFLTYQYKADILKKTANGETPLQLAAGNGHLNVVQYLIDKYNVDILEPASTPHGDTAIHIAALRGRLNIVGYFIEQKEVNVNILNGKGQSPVFSATIGNHTNIVRYLVEEYHANVTTKDEDRNTILHYAFANENLAVTRYLLDEKLIDIDINASNNLGETLAVMAIEQHNMKLLQYIVDEKKAEINTPDRYGEYPLHKAVKTNNLEIVQYLIVRGANPAVKNFYDKTPYDIARLHNKYLQYGMPTKLLDYLRLVHPRRRRSLSFHRPFNQIFNINDTVKEFAAQLEGSRRTVMQDSNIEYAHAFLSLVDASIKFATKSRYHLANNESLLSHDEIIERKIEPLAINATERFLNSEKVGPSFDTKPVSIPFLNR